MKKYACLAGLTALCLSLPAYAAQTNYTAVLGVAPFSIMNNQDNQILIQLLSLQTGLSTTPAGNWTVFTTGAYSPSTMNNLYKQDSGAFTVGTASQYSRNGIYGFSIGRSMDTLNYSPRYNGTVTLDENMVSAFTGYKTHHLYGDIIGSYGNIDDSNIYHNVGGQNFTGSTTGQHYALNGQAGYNFNFLNNTLKAGPVVAANWQNLSTYAYTETSSTGTQLQYNTQDTDALITGAGFQVNYLTQIKNTQVIPFLEALYTRPIFNSVNNIIENNNFVNINTGIQGVFSTGLMLTASYNTQVGQSNTQAQSFMVSASMPVM